LKIEEVRVSLICFIKDYISLALLYTALTAALQIHLRQRMLVLNPELLYHLNWQPDGLLQLD